jgi:hypothetical protein
MGRRWFYLSAPLVAVVVYPVAALCVAAFNGQPWLVVVSSMHGIVYVVGLVLGSALAVAVVTAAGRAANRLQLANPYEFEMPPREAFYRLCAAAVLLLMFAWFDLGIVDMNGGLGGEDRTPELALALAFGAATGLLVTFFVNWPERCSRNT